MADKFQSIYMDTQELMELTAIDGEYNLPRVRMWQEAAESEIKSFTGFNVYDSTVYLGNDLVIDFINVARIFIQERVRESFLAPNYIARGIDSLKIRLSLMVEYMQSNNVRRFRFVTSDRKLLVTKTQKRFLVRQ